MLKYNIFNIISEEKYEFIDNFLNDNKNNKNRLDNQNIKEYYSLFIYNINKKIYEETSIDKSNINKNLFSIIPIKILNKDKNFINIKCNKNTQNKIKNTLSKLIDNFNIKKYNIYFNDNLKIVFINIINKYDLNKIRHKLLGNWDEIFLFIKKDLYDEENEDLKFVDMINHKNNKNLNKIINEIEFNKDSHEIKLKEIISGIEI